MMMHHAKQHIIPQCYLKAWLDPNTPENYNPYVWCFPKTGEAGFNKAPSNLFTENDFYTIKTPDGERHLELEHGLSTLESDFASTLKDVVSQEVELSIDEKLVIASFASAMNSRTRPHANSISSPFQEMLDMANIAQQKLDNRDPNDTDYARTIVDEDAPTISIEDVQHIADNPINATIQAKLQSDLRFFLNMHFTILQTDSNPGFITSDDPCIITDQEERNIRFHLESPTVEVLLPLSPNQCLLLSWRGEEGYQDVGEDIVMHINKKIAKYAEANIVVNAEYNDPEWYINH